MFLAVFALLDEHVNERADKRPLLRGLTDGQMTSRCGGNGPRGSGSPREEERDYFA